MPLNRDQPHESIVRDATPSVPTDHQRTHSIVGSDLSLRSRPSTPQSGMNNQSAKRENVNPKVPDGGRKFQLEEGRDDFAQPAVQLYKMPTIDTMQKHQAGRSQHSASTRFLGANSKQEVLQASTSMTKSKRVEKQKASAFDDTETLNQSLLEEFPDDGHTTLRNPSGVAKYKGREFEYLDPHDQGQTNGLQDQQEEVYPVDWIDQVEDERRIQGAIHSNNPNNVIAPARGRQGDLRPPNTLVARPESQQEPETPTRPQSAPLVKAQLHAPAAQKTVNFASSDLIHNLSPSFRSSDLGRDDSFEQPISRPNSAQPRVQVISDQRTPPSQQHFHGQSTYIQSVLPLQSARFQQPAGHLQAVRQGGEKVSAPESDNQDFSEDERTQIHQQYSRQDKPLDPQIMDSRSVPSRKRSHDDMINELDYSRDQLKQKSLSALQAEAFTRNPKAGPHLPPTDSVGNEMTLSQILENLSKVPEDAQRETFTSLTDEQWARTGQWFVDKFQADLQKLTEIRLQRRQIALKHEDAIRRRQRLVEHHQAEVNRELQELQTGGSRLVDGRKVPSGSRSGTPMKSGR